MTLAEAADYLRVKYGRAAELVRQDILPHFRLGRQIRVSRRQLESFVETGGKALPGPGGWRKEAR